MTEQIVVPRNSWFDVFIYLSAYRYTASDNPSLHKSDSSLSVSSKSIEHIQRSISRSHIYLRGCRNPWEFCSKPYCGALIPQSVNRHLDAGRLINFFIWQSSCCQLHTSVPARDKITFPIKMNTHASALLLGRFPPQCCGVVYCHVLKPLRLDVILTSFQTPFHMPRHSLGPVTLDSPVCCPADGSEGKRDLHVALAFHVLPMHCAERACWCPECATYWCL